MKPAQPNLWVRGWGTRNVRKFALTPWLLPQAGKGSDNRTARDAVLIEAGRLAQR